MEEKSLYEAAATGNVGKLFELLQNDHFLLDRVSYTSPNNTPLHIATMKNHLPFVEKILELNPHLSEQLNSQQSSPLHIASTKGYLEIAKKLVEAGPDMCMSRDRQGRNPLHLAAMQGHVRVVEALVSRAPLAAWERVDRGLTVLHLCVKHGRFEALKVLVERVNMKKMMKVKNSDGKTALDIAVDDEQVEIIKYLKNNSNEETTPATRQQKQTPPEKWLSKKRDSIMVVAILVATMAFTVGVNPPGGVWPEDSKDHTAEHYQAGESVMAYKHNKVFKSYMKSNTICFVSSLSTILLLIGGLPFRRRLFMWILMVIMWLTITTIAITFALSIDAVTPKKDKKSLTHVIRTAVVVWASVMGILLVGNTMRLVDRWLKNRDVYALRWFRNLGKGKGKENAKEETCV